MRELDELFIFRSFCKNRVVVIWGLKTFNHTHAYIHANYYRVLKRNQIKVIWLDDKERNRRLVPQNAIVICVSLAVNHIPFRSDLTYFAHNIPESKKYLFNDFHVLFYENYKKDFVGTPHKTAGLSILRSAERLLAQPYGTPVSKHLWVDHNNLRLQKMQETWVGSIWNDSQNRGNERVIESYVKILHDLGISFRQVEFGKFGRYPFSARLEEGYISNSIFGASVHSNHQIAESNIVCRFFKSISFGKVPTTNQIHAENFFPGAVVADLDLPTLVERRLQLSKMESIKRVKLAQEQLSPYTYEAGFNRLALAIRNDWS